MKYLLMIQSNESVHPEEAKLAKIIAQHNETSAALRDAGKWVDSHEALDWARELTHGLEACEVRPVWGPR